MEIRVVKHLKLQTFSPFLSYGQKSQNHSCFGMPRPEIEVSIIDEINIEEKVFDG